MLFEFIGLQDIYQAASCCYHCEALRAVGWQAVQPGAVLSACSKLALQLWCPWGFEASLGCISQHARSLRKASHSADQAQPAMHCYPERGQHLPEHQDVPCCTGAHKDWQICLSPCGAP